MDRQDGKSTSNTRLFKASLEQKLAQKIVPGAVDGLLLAIYENIGPPGWIGGRMYVSSQREGPSGMFVILSYSAQR